MASSAECKPCFDDSIAPYMTPGESTIPYSALSLGVLSAMEETGVAEMISSRRGRLEEVSEEPVPDDAVVDDTAKVVVRCENYYDLDMGCDRACWISDAGLTVKGVCQRQQVAMEAEAQAATAEPALRQAVEQ